ncbi:MAG: DNA polymerase III subunit alpha, partial [Chloroflexota bacterium]|nr:DNA polymerase III subunit alpha [Chloroflexota bacterium]
LFAWRPAAVTNAGEIAASCGVDLSFSQHRHPRFPLPQGHTERTYLHKLCLDGALQRYGSLRTDVQQGLRHELEVISKLGLENFFLVVWDIMRYAREHGIPAQGRGSAADSIVAYVLGITRVDPIRHNLLFERFLNEEREGMPDIDIDVSTNHREELIQYVYDKYGQEHTAMVATLITYRARSAVRDVGKALGFPSDVLDATAKTLDAYSHVDRLRAELPPQLPPLGSEPSPLAPQPSPWSQLLEMCEAIEGFPRHLSIHVGGMIITEGPLVDVVPLEHATAPGRVVTQYDKDDLEDLGLIKIDLLGLRTLSLVSDVLDEIEAHTGSRPDLDRLPEDDRGVYDMLCQADCIGVFQVESRAQSQTLPKMLPRKLDDLVVEIAIIRPGPLQGNMVHPYLRRRQGLEPVEYLHPSLEPILGETLGVCIFQEQVIRIATDVAGFRPGEADLFRRAMGSHRSRDEMERIRERFVAGATTHAGMDLPAAQELFRQLAGFASFGFCKSHAAAFARTTYETAWIKLHYPAALYTALLNNQPMGFYSPEVIIGDARRHGVRTLRVDINHSRARCRVENGHVRLGFNYVQDIGERALERLEAEQARGSYRSLEEFYERTGLDRDAIESLIFAGAFDSFRCPRRRLLWELNRLQPRATSHESRARTPQPSAPGSHPLRLDYDWPEPRLRPMTAYEQVAEEYMLLGLSPSHQLLEFHRQAMDREGLLSAEEVQTMRSGWVR